MSSKSAIKVKSCEVSFLIKIFAIKPGTLKFITSMINVETSYDCFLQSYGHTPFSHSPANMSKIEIVIVQKQ